MLSSFKEKYELEGCISQALRNLRIDDFYSRTPCGDIIPRVVVLWKLEFTILSEHDYDVVGVRQISRPFLNCCLAYETSLSTKKNLLFYTMFTSQQIRSFHTGTTKGLI